MGPPTLKLSLPSSPKKVATISSPRNRKKLVGVTNRKLVTATTAESSPNLLRKKQNQRLARAAAALKVPHNSSNNISIASPPSPRVRKLLRTNNKSDGENFSYSAAQVLGILHERNDERLPAQLRQFFQRLTNYKKSDAILTFEAFEKGFKEFSFNLSSTVAHEIYNSIDVNNDGKVTLKEFLNGLNPDLLFNNTNSSTLPWHRESIIVPVVVLDNASSPLPSPLSTESPRKDLRVLQSSIKNNESITQLLCKNHLATLRAKLPRSALKIRQMILLANPERNNSENNFEISTTELKTYLQNLNLNMPNQSINLIVSMCDSDNSGKVHLPEISAVFNRLASVDGGKCQGDTLDTTLSPRLVKVGANKVVEKKHKRASAAEILDGLSHWKNVSTPKIVKRVYKDTRYITQPLDGVLNPSYNNNFNNNGTLKDNYAWKYTEKLQLSPRKVTGPRNIAAKTTLTLN